MGKSSATAASDRRKDGSGGEELRHEFQHGPDLDLFILTYFAQVHPQPLPPQPWTERLQALVAAVGPAKILAALERRSRIRQEAATQHEELGEGSAELKGPRINWSRLRSGAAYSSECHVEVPDFEKRVLRDLKDGLNIVLEGPLSHGKSWWQQRLQSQLEPLPGYRCLTINFADWSPESYENPERLFPRLQREFLQQLRVDKDELETDRQEVRSLTDVWNVIRVWRQRPEVRATQLVLFLDSAERLMGTRSQDEFFSPLRDLVQRTKRLGVVLCLGRATAGAPGKPNRSRLALGQVLKVPDFQPPQVQKLAAQYPLPSLSSQDLAQLWTLIGGAPHLNRMAFYQAARKREQPFSALLEEACAVAMGGTLFGEALLNLKEQLEAPDLRVLREVYQRGAIGREHAEAAADKLESHLGLIVGNSKTNRWQLRYPLYLHLLDVSSEADVS